MKLAWSWLKDNGPKIGEWALGLAGSLIGWIATNAGPALSKLGEWLGAIGGWIVDTAYPYLQEQVPIWADALWEWIQTDGFDTLKKLWQWIRAIGRWIRDTAWPWLTEKTAEWGTALWSWIQTDGFDALKKLWEWIRSISRWIADTAWPWLKDKTSAWASALFEWIGTDAAAAIGKMGEWLTSLGNYISNDLGPLLEEKMAALTDYLWTWLEGDDAEAGTKSAARDSVEKFAIAFATEFVPGMARALKGIYDALVSAVSGIFRASASKPPKTSSPASPPATPDSSQEARRTRRFSLGRQAKELIDRVFPFANGGIVTKPTLGLVGEAGPEAIIPLSKMGSMGGTTVNVTINGAVDPVSTARQIRQILEQDQRRLGRLAAV
jgi:hypothetical protein